MDVMKMSPDIEAPLRDFPSSRRGWLTRLGRFDPVGPLVVGHAVSLAVLGSVRHPIGVLALAGGLLVWRVVLAAVAGQLDRERRGGVFLARGLGSLVLVGGLVVLDGGTESPLFFAMLVVVVWEAAMNPLRRLLWLGSGAVLVYVSVILGVPDVTPTSLARLGVFVFFIGLLVWARALSEYWQRESVEAKALAAGIVEEAPNGFVLYDSGSLRCLFANQVASGLGLDTPEKTVLIRYGASSGEETVEDVLTGAVTSGEPPPPTLYVVSPGTAEEKFLRIGMTRRPVPNSEDLLMVYAEDVTAQVSAGEQHRRFLESANHQFRTPLSPIVAYSDLIARGDLKPGELQEAGVAIGDAARRIETLLDRISSLLRLQRDPNRSMRTMTVGELIEVHLLGADPDLDMLIVIEDGRDLAVRCDPGLLTGALLELVDNGRRHGTPPVIICAKMADDRVGLSLCDRGPGPGIEPGTPLDHTWGLLAHPEVMPPQMGERLGITYAYTLTQAAGGSLRFQRDETGWAFVFDLPGVRPGGGHPGAQIPQAASVTWE